MLNRLGILAVSALLLTSTGCKKKMEAEPSTSDASTTSTTAPKEEGVTFGKKAPAVGDKRDETQDMDMNMDINVDLGNGKPQKQSMKMKESEKKTVEVMAVNGNAPSKVKVTYQSVEKHMTEGDKPDHSKPSPISGKTYIVEAKDGKVAVTDANGKAAPPVEAKEVEKDFKSLGKPDPMSDALPSTPLKPGDKVDSMSKALTDFLNKDTDEKEGVKVSNVNVTFKEKSGDEGVFDIALTVSKEEGPMAMNIDMKGQAKMLVKNSQPTKLELKGPITIAAKPDPKAKMKMDGSGNMSMVMTAK